MSRRGLSLILSFMVILVLSILCASIIVKSTSESRIAQKYNQSAQAFWLAESGINEAVKQLNTDPNWTGTAGPVPLGNGTYSVTVGPVLGYSLHREINSTGSVATSQRKIKVIVSLPWAPNPQALGYAIETTGDLKIKGSVNIDPPGSTHTLSSLDFEDIFGADKDTIKSEADHLYNDPPTNQQPVAGITWVDLSPSAKYSISSDWTGSGLLVVDGHRTQETEDVIALEITGDWTFNGMIWVIGRIKIAGTPLISGGVFAETAVDVESDLTGDPTLNYIPGDIESAFGLLGGSSQVSLRTWEECTKFGAGECK